MAHTDKNESDEGGAAMNREQAHDILMRYMEGDNYITHSYAVEAIMKGLAKRLAPEEEIGRASCRERV